MTRSICASQRFLCFGFCSLSRPKLGASRTMSTEKPYVVSGQFFFELRIAIPFVGLHRWDFKLLLRLWV